MFENIIENIKKSASDEIRKHDHHSQAIGVYDRKHINKHQAEGAHVTFSKNSFLLKIAE